MFQNNHLIDTVLLEDQKRRDFSVPCVVLLEEAKREDWNEQVLENVVKSINTQMTCLYEAKIKDAPITNEVIKGMSFEEFLKILQKIRIYDNVLTETVALRLLADHPRCYFQTNLEKENFEIIKKKFRRDIDLSSNELSFSPKFSRTDCVLTYVNFINSVLVLLQYKY